MRFATLVCYTLNLPVCFQCGLASPAKINGGMLNIVKQAELVKAY